MKKIMKSKLKKKSGFTLVELLIVVAIIAILVAISIPLVQTALEKSKHAVDQANIRDAIGLGNIELLTDSDFISGGTVTEKTYNYVVDENHQGKLAESATTNVVEAKCTCENHPTEALKVTVNTDGKVIASWTTDTTTGKTITNTAFTTTGTP